MASKKLLTIFGATGNQGGSVIATVLANPSLNTKYSLRGITRDTKSSKSQALADQGVEMVEANLNDVASLKAAARGAYGFYGMTDFWAVMSKEVEVQQGKNLFEAVRAEGVRHYVWSSLPFAERLTGGVLKHVDHFDGKAMVEEHVEGNKGDMIVSYFLPAMFMSNAHRQAKNVNGTPTMALPFPSQDIAWPLIDPRRDVGKYVMGLFEGGESANGAKVHGVSAWTTPAKVVAALSKESGKTVEFKTVPGEVYAGFLPEAVREELLETMLLIGDYSYYGKGEETRQEESDKWLIPGADLLSYEQWAKENGPFEF